MEAEMSNSSEYDPERLPSGLYEALMDAQLARLVAALPDTLKADTKRLDPAESPMVLARYVASVLQEKLSGVHGEDKIAAQITLCNALLQVLHGEDSPLKAPDQCISDQAERLMAVVARNAATPVAASAPPAPVRPETPLSASSLFTGTRVDPSLVSQLRKEIGTADQIDILCSFIKWSGVRILAEDLRAFTARPECRRKM